ncbi:MAG TPA: efflux RND transporter periplasmic adaptor subunit [Terriglobales bacterium]|nr:efflux RND transporter periplasmic adaptor subunit [Terriglobales bacterium]
MRKRTNARQHQQVGILVLLACLCGCSKEAATKPPVVEVQVAQVRRGEIQQIVSSEAILFPINQAAITPKITSPVEKFYVNRGSVVRAGQLLAVLENRDLQAATMDNLGAFEQAQAQYKTATGAAIPEENKKAQTDFEDARKQLDVAKQIYDSRQKLYDEGALPRKDLDSASLAYVQAQSQFKLSQQHLEAYNAVSHQASLKSAAGQLASAEGKYLASKAQLGYTEIRTPIAGVVTERSVHESETAIGGTPLLTVMDTREVIAKAHIPQEQAALLKVGDAGTLNSPETGPISGKVTVVSPALDPNSTTVEVWVQAPNRDGKLRPGSTVSLAIVAKTVKDSLTVPASALLTAPDGTTTVMLAGNDGKGHLQPVEAGVREKDEVQITKGLTQGQTVITQGAYGLPDNTDIKVLQPTPASSESQGKDKSAEEPSAHKSSKQDVKD